MAHKIRVRPNSEKKPSDWEIVSFILAIILLLSGPGFFRAGMMLNITNVSFSLTYLILGLLATCVGLVFLLHSKLLGKHNKIVASVFCFYASVNSIFLLDAIEKMKIAAHNIAEAAAMAGTESFILPDMEKRVALMEMLNFTFIIVFMIIGFILLMIYIYQCHLDSERMPPEPPGPRTIFL